MTTENTDEKTINNGAPLLTPAETNELRHKEAEEEGLYHSTDGEHHHHHHHHHSSYDDGYEHHHHHSSYDDGYEHHHHHSSYDEGHEHHHHHHHHHHHWYDLSKKQKHVLSVFGRGAAAGIFFGAVAGVVLLYFIDNMNYCLLCIIGGLVLGLLGALLYLFVYDDEI